MFVWHKRDLTRALDTPLDRRNPSSDKASEAHTYRYMTRDQDVQAGSTPSPNCSLFVWVLTVDRKPLTLMVLRQRLNNYSECEKW